MTTLDIGTICVKTFGRENGKRCIIIDMIDKNFVLITGPPKITGIKRRRVNIKHLEATEEKIDVKKGSSDEEITEILQKTQLKSEKAPTEKKRKSS